MAKIFEAIKNDYVKVDGILSIEDLVSMYLLKGYSKIDKFGATSSDVEAGTSADIWEGNDILPEYQCSSTADIISISSDSVLDDHVLSVLGQDINNNEVSFNVTLNGQTRVALPTALYRIYRIENEDISPLNGRVYVYSGTENTGGVPSGASQLKATIEIGNEQTQMALYTVPRGKVGFLKRGEFGIQHDGGRFDVNERAVVQYKSKRQGGVFKVKKTVTLMTGGHSNYLDVRTFADVLPSGIDIKIHIASVSEDMGAWAAFDIMLVDENNFPDEFLEAIGQLGY